MRFVDFLTGGRPPLGAGFEVVERAGCDLNPLDPATDEGKLTLLACIFPDEFARFDLLERAIAVARETPATVERADLARWVADRLARPRPGVATVVYHTIVWPYLPDAVRDAAEAALAAAGERATAAAPLALLSFEGTAADPSRTELHLTRWPGGERRLLADSSHHPVTVALDLTGACPAARDGSHRLGRAHPEQPERPRDDAPGGDAERDPEGLEPPPARPPRRGSRGRTR